MAPINVLICTDVSILGHGIQSLLATQDNLEVNRATFTDPNQLLQIIKVDHPDVLILSMEYCETEVHRIVSSFLSFPMSVIVIPQEGNTVLVYKKREETLTRIEDLVSLIKEQ